MFTSVVLIRIGSSSSKNEKYTNRNSPEAIQKVANSSSSVDNGVKRMFPQAEKTAISTTTL